MVQAAPTGLAQTAQRGAATQSSCSEVQNIRVNVHFMQHDDGSGNFTEFNDGHPCNPSTTDTGYSYAQVLIETANDQMDRNPPLNLTVTPAPTPIPKRIRWVLDGVYFDRSSYYRDAAGANGSPYRRHEALCVKADSVLNIFLVEEVSWPYSQPNNCGPNTTIVANRGYVYMLADCANATAPPKMWAAVSSPWTSYIRNNVAAWQLASTLNHELCHLLGLNHPYQNLSTCADAPPHPDYPNWVLPNGQYGQCWNLNEPAGAHCNVWSKVSNNLMDYNAGQSSLSPCQIGIMQDNLNSCLQARYVFKCSNNLPTRATFSVPATTCGQLTNIWLDGRASFNVHSFRIDIDWLKTISQNNWPASNVHYDGTWSRKPGREQLDVLYTFQPNSYYRIKLTTYNVNGSQSVRVGYLSTVCAAESLQGGTSSTSKNSSTSSMTSHD